MKEDLAPLVDKFAGKNILVIGDMIADIYIDGKISRISREAPVLVLEEQDEKVIAGGAANVVNNIATLGGTAMAVGIVGLDMAAKGLRSALTKNGAVTNGLFTDEKRPTISKTRIIAGGRATVSQQIVRLDKEWHKTIAKASEDEIIKYLSKELPKADGIVISDYGSGTVTDTLRNKLIAYASENNIPSMVDSRYNVLDFKNIGYVKQNDSELATAVGRVLKTDEELYAAGRELLNRLNAAGVLVTRGEKGMVLFEKNGAIHDIPVTDKSEVFDVSGAGDTCVATVILALAAGGSPEKAAKISNFASGIAVRKLGTATVSSAELKNVLTS